jgi:hypothetical protein
VQPLDVADFQQPNLALIDRGERVNPLRLFRSHDQAASRWRRDVPRAILASMSRSYAISWQEANESLHSGKLELRASGLTLDGGNGAGPASILIPYGDLVGLKFAPGHERLAGRPTLVLGRRGGDDIRIASVGSAGVISEVAEQMASMRSGNAISSERVAVVVPLRKGKRAKAERLVDKGPPFDPERVGLESHEVFLGDREAIFIFNAVPGFSLRELLADSKVWASAAAWRDVIAGPPRIAKSVFAWANVAGANGLSFEPTPGPGDSEGGDIYSP